ncbi:hypothetical protein [Kribbella antiqua]|uniref:hypothetical protein n=1 Tax=Kribbella antiqua TaxID=2512217 RepID=UPI00105231B8|nr:hypothetical protein [Kribbella antiqua]
MIKRGLLGLTLVLALRACSSGTDTPAGGDSSSETPSLTAADGKNYAACDDGNCEVLIEKSATLTIGGKQVDATVADGYVQLAERGADGFKVGVSGSGGTGWGGSDGTTYSLSLKGAAGTTAVIVLSSGKG